MCKRKTIMQGFNSFIAHEPDQEYHIDLLFINDLVNQDYDIVLIIDIFYKVYDSGSIEN